MIVILTNLHLGPTILEPKLDLSSLKTKFFAELQSLLFIRMRAFFEHTGKRWFFFWGNKEKLEDDAKKKRKSEEKM